MEINAERGYPSMTDETLSLRIILGSVRAKGQMRIDLQNIEINHMQQWSGLITYSMLE